MLTTSARLLRLLGLLQAQGDWTGAGLAVRLGVTQRTVRRDVDRLRELGYPVDARPGVAGGYRLAIGATLPPLLLDDTEAVAVAVGLRAATLSGVGGLDEAAVMALTKLERLLPSRLRARVRTLQDAVVPVADVGPRLDVEVLLTVAGAVRDRQRLRIDYTARDGRPSRREVEPHRVVHSGRWWYLVAWDVERSDWRTLRLDRLTPRIPLGRRFEPRALPDDAARFTAESITTRVYRFRCRVTVHAPAAVVAERIGPTVGVVTALDDASCEVLTGSDSLEEVALYLGLIGAQMTVHEPAELREVMGALGDRLVRASGR